MRSSTVTTVLQATAIYTASILLTHHASKTLFSDVLTNPGVAKFAATVMNDTSLMNNANDTLRKETPSNSEVAVEADGKKSDDGSEGPWLQITIPNGTELDWSVPDTKPQEPFYTKELPIDVFAHLVMCTLQYYWLLWLAHILPARSRRRSVIVKEKGEMSEDREEEVIKKWIAQGRVHRASLNWCNTFFKWVLNLTVGRVWWFAALHVVRRSLRLQSPKKTWEDMLQVSRLTTFLFPLNFQMAKLISICCRLSR